VPRLHARQASAENGQEAIVRLSALGMDAARKDWVGVVLDPEGWFVAALTARSISPLVDAVDGEIGVVAIDMPIGLPDTGSRRADAAARRMLGGRHSSVFSSPARSVMVAETYEAAAAAHHAATGKGLTVQTWGLRAKLIEVDLWVRSEPAVRVVEVHPEVSFAAMKKSPLTASKHSWTGQAERRQLLANAGGEIPTDLGEAGRCGVDDVLDAAAAAWTARRVLTGVAQRAPDPPDRFSDGLESAIYS
jgi:predicted RNase H-like nuclease